MATQLRLSVVPTRPFRVKVADGTSMNCNGRYEEVPVQLEGTLFNVTLYALPLTGIDIVLGIQWLEQLGRVTCDWKSSTMEFEWNDQPCKLRGLLSGTTTAIAAHTLEKEFRQGQPLFAVCLLTSSDSIAPVASELRDLIDDYDDIFTTPTTLPPPRDIEHRIPLKEGTDPVNVRPYRYAYFQKDEIERQVDTMLQAGIIQPSSSPFSSPVLLVKKKDDTWRFCTDYRALNAVTIKDRFPIPTIDDMLDELHGAAFFSKLDLTAGYHQVRVHPSDVYKTAFRTHHGHFEYLVMPFGLCNAPSTFQALMNSIFRPLLRKSVLVFFDDILVYSSSWQDHVHHVRQVFNILRDHQLFVKFKKCEFGKSEIEYLGHIITALGVKVDQSKIQAMLDWPRPATITELRGFLGLTGYYRKFVQNYGLIARNLTNLLKKGRFLWDSNAEEAFHKLKTAMTTTPTLALPNFTLPFLIQTDASGDGIGAVLTQNQQPIAYMSRALGPSKRAWSTYAREMLAIVIAIQTWRPYLLGRHFIIQTDQQSLKHLLEQRELTPEQQKWVAKLVGYDYEILYKPGRTNSVADALSRVPGSPCLHTLFVSHPQIWEDIRSASIDDPYMQQMITRAKTTSSGPFSWRNDLLYFHNRVVVPPSSPLISTLLKEFHDSPLGGHSGVQRTTKRISQQFYWPSMRNSVHAYVTACDVCQRAKSVSAAPGGLLHPLPVPCRVWDDITMEFIDALPRSEGATSILVVVDRLSKYAHFIALSHPYTAKSVAQVFVVSVVKLHGMPQSIVSDRDPIFISTFWREFMRLSGIALCMTSAYHPQSDGQSEVVNRCLEQYLRCFASSRPHHWRSFLPWAELWYNTTFHSSIGMTPFQALYGRPLPPFRPILPVPHLWTHLISNLRTAPLCFSSLSPSCNKPLIL